MIEAVDHDGRYWTVQGREVTVTIERRPVYCDRGRYIAKVFPRGSLAMSFDEADGWPRYYFAWSAMLSEIEAWLEVREQVPA